MEGKNKSRHGDPSVAPSEQHDDAAAEDVEPSPLLSESPVELPLASNLHGMLRKLGARQREEECS